jgi:hypothetical protein
MSKKKNTLKDLDEFLKQQAASIVEPAKLGIQSSDKENKELLLQEKGANDFEHVTHQLKLVAENQGIDFRVSLYDFIIQSIESLDQSLPEDKMLINTALYLKSGDQWKETIRQYWRSKRGYEL